MKTSRSIDVLFVLLPDTLVLDWAGPAEAFRIANRLRMAAGHAAPFNLRFIGPRPAATGSVGAVIANIEALPQQLKDPAWLVLCGMPSTKVHAEAAASRAAVQWLRGLQPGSNGLHLITICSGALLAAQAGLLRGHTATTHHQHLEDLRAAEPDCEVMTNRVFVQDGAVSSSAGVTTGIDLALHLVSQECGPACAARVAQTMVVALRRGPNDPEHSPLLAYRNHMHPALHRVQDAIAEHPKQNWTVPRMAAIAHTSPRHLTRLFLSHTAITPLQYLRRMRLGVAELSLRSGHSVTRAAELAGFGSDTQLRRAWRGFGRTGTPSEALSEN